MNSKGFEISNISVDYPGVKRNYGELLELKLTYKYISKIQSIPMFGMDCRDLVVSRVSYSKIWELRISIAFWEIISLLISFNLQTLYDLDKCL